MDSRLYGLPEGNLLGKPLSQRRCFWVPIWSAIASRRCCSWSQYVEGVSVAEIARRSERGEKAAESMLHRARLGFARVFELLAKRRGGLE